MYGKVHILSSSMDKYSIEPEDGFSYARERIIPRRATHLDPTSERPAPPAMTSYLIPTCQRAVPQKINGCYRGASPARGPWHARTCAIAQQDRACRTKNGSQRALTSYLKECVVRPCGMTEPGIRGRSDESRGLGVMYVWVVGCLRIAWQFGSTCIAFRRVLFIWLCVASEVATIDGHVESPQRRRKAGTQT